MPFPTRFFILALALALDRLVGDPPALWRRVPHPIVWMGRGIAALDARLNDVSLDFATRRRRGVLATGTAVAVAAVVGLAIHGLALSLPFGAGIEAMAAAVMLAHKSLLDHVQAVAVGLERDGLAGGRSAVAQIVGRDVAQLDEAGVARAAIESAAENFSDGLVAPAFWYLLLGLPGLLVFKIVNTADSMIGHRSEKYEAFGWASARLDDLLNLVPARLTALLIAGASQLLHRRGSAAWACAQRDARRHKSPNAGWPEAALAGALGLALGGPRRYGATEVDGAWLNPGARSGAKAEDIRIGLLVIDAAWALSVVAVATVAFILLALAR